MRLRYKICHYFLFHPGAFDVHATMAALEHFVDTARENADAEVVRYNAILRQTIN